METGTAAPELTQAKPYLIEQDWAGYTLERHACAEYLDGFSRIGLQQNQLPNLSEVTKRLRPRTGWSSTPVSGFLPAGAFFEMLAARMFPTTTWIRSKESLEYTPEPDIFHDVFGHVPMHAHPVFADFLQHYGSVCARAADAEILERLGRLFWYTVEFGLIREDGEIKVYGSGVISSHKECTNVIERRCDIHDFDLDEVLDTPVKVDELQKCLFAIESFEQIYEAMQEAERRLV